VLDQETTLVSMEGVSRRYGELVALDNVTLQVPRGTILGVIGPSGSGKTTLIRLLTGTLDPSEGNVTVLGQTPRKFTRHAREKLGYMPQHFVLYDELTASENVSFVASLFGLLWPRRGRRVNQMLKLVDLWEARGRRARQLSGGMQRRLELACALVHDPQLLFVDEPTAGLDPILRQKVWTEFRRLRDVGRTLVVTTQVISEAEYCDCVALLSRGRLVALASPEELRRTALGGDVIEITTAHAFDAARGAGGRPQRPPERAEALPGDRRRSRHDHAARRPGGARAGWRSRLQHRIPPVLRRGLHGAGRQRGRRHPGSGTGGESWAHFAKRSSGCLRAGRARPPSSAKRCSRSSADPGRCSA
jgi:ABC-2 type transport system ATP-binding protein